MNQALGRYSTAREARIAASAGLVQSTAAQRQALGEVVDLAKSIPRHAENITHGDHTLLQLLGWGARRSRSSNGGTPGQVMNLEMLKEGEDWVLLEWREPVDGGPVVAYRIMRRRLRDGDWTQAGMAVETRALLNEQETGVELEYQVVAVNKAGEGPSSNLVRAKL